MGTQPGAREVAAPAWLRGVVGAAHGAALTSVVMLIAVAGLQAAPAPDGRDLSGGDGGAPTALTRTLERAVVSTVAPTGDSRCGDARAAADGSGALIRTGRGDVRQVSFERGWDVYTGRRPGTLLAVCAG